MVNSPPGALAGFVAPSVIGWAKESTGKLTAGLLVVAGSLAVGAVLVMCVPRTADSTGAVSRLHWRKAYAREGSIAKQFEVKSLPDCSAFRYSAKVPTTQLSRQRHARDIAAGVNSKEARRLLSSDLQSQARRKLAFLNAVQSLK